MGLAGASVPPCEAPPAQAASALELSEVAAPQRVRIRLGPFDLPRPGSSLSGKIIAIQPGAPPVEVRAGLPCRLAAQEPEARDRPSIRSSADLERARGG